MADVQRTLLLVKPDGVQRLLVGRVLTRFEERGLKLVGLKLVSDRPRARREALRGPPREAVLRGLVDFITRAARRRCPRGTQRDRDRPGDERRDPAARGGARLDPRRLRVETAQNLVHASDSPETAAAELALWFRPEELLGYEREIDRWVLAPEE